MTLRSARRTAERVLASTGFCWIACRRSLARKTASDAVRIPKRTERLKHRQAAEVFLLIEHIDRQRPRALQLQQERFMHMGGKVVQGQKRCHFLCVKCLGIQPDAEILLKIFLIRHGKIPEV